MKVQIKQILAVGILLLAVLPQGLTAQMMAWEDNYGAVFDGGWLDAAVIETTTQQPEPSPSPSPEVVPYEENVPAPPLSSPSPGYHENPYGPIEEDPGPKFRKRTVQGQPKTRLKKILNLKPGERKLIKTKIHMKLKDGKRPKEKEKGEVWSKGKKVGTYILKKPVIKNGYVTYTGILIIADDDEAIESIDDEIGGFETFTTDVEVDKETNLPEFPELIDNSSIPDADLPINPELPVIDVQQPLPPLGNFGGVKVSDAQQLHDDINKVLARANFSKFKKLIKRGKRNNKATFNKINEDDLQNALKGLTPDEVKFGRIVANSINSDKPLLIEYFEGDEIIASKDQQINSTVKKAIFDKRGKDFRNKLLTTMGSMTVGFVLRFNGGGATAEHDGGTYSAVNFNDGEYRQGVTSLHEIFGHGRPISQGRLGTTDEDAIRFENMVWRLLNMPGNQRDGRNHGQRDGIPLEDYTDLPNYE